MIFDAVVKLLMVIAKGVLALFPTYTLPSEISTLTGTTGTWLATLNRFFPLSTLGLCIGLVLAVRLFVLVVRLCVFIYDLIPFKAT